ncbi:hypothetical protein AA313_de0205709 [Arthrobotrys entomopaga]|nr:hypothetical protein AA313_de0205709 [Arthrobotrys entomopaga]
MKAPSILFIGLTHTSKLLPPGVDIDPDILRLALEQSVIDCTTAGFDVVPFYFEPEDISKFQEKLKEQKWDAVIIGLAVRGNPPLTPFFEKLVNMVREHDPNIKLGFNVSPASTVDACQRLFPAVQPLAVE